MVLPEQPQRFRLDRTNLVQRIIACLVLQEHYAAVLDRTAISANECKEAHRFCGPITAIVYHSTLEHWHLNATLFDRESNTWRSSTGCYDSFREVYFRAKFLDGSAQDSLDLWTTGYSPGMEEDAPLRSRGIE